MRRWVVLAVTALVAAPAWAAELAPETPHVVVPGPSNGHRLYVGSFPAAHGVDGKIIVLNGDNLKMIGEVANGFFGLMALSPDGGTLYSATTFFSRGDHGVRTDVVELYDTTTLNLAGEVVLPPKRAQTTPYDAYLVPSAGGTFLYVQNATPASSVTIVDPSRRRVLAEIPTDGCIGIFPSPVRAGRFSTLCGDGAAVTIDIDADGHEVARRRGAKLFDPQNDALFISGANTWNGTLFVSFLGNVHEVDFSGPVATQKAPWPLVTGEDAANGWRPGGYQIAAYDRANGQLYVTMHPHGYEGSHKAAAEAIWRADVARHMVVARGPGKGVVALTVTQDAHPLLFGVTLETGQVYRFDGDSLAPLANTPEGGAVESGLLMAVQ